MAYMYVDIDLSDTDTEDLIDELKARGHFVFEESSTSQDKDLEKIWLARRNGQAYDHLIDAYIYKVLGKVI